MGDYSNPPKTSLTRMSSLGGMSSDVWSQTLARDDIQIGTDAVLLKYESNFNVLYTILQSQIVLRSGSVTSPYSPSSLSGRRAESEKSFQVMNDYSGYLHHFYLISVYPRDCKECKEFLEIGRFLDWALCKECTSQYRHYLRQQSRQSDAPVTMARTLSNNHSASTTPRPIDCLLPLPTIFPDTVVQPQVCTSMSMTSMNSTASSFRSANSSFHSLELKPKIRRNAGSKKSDTQQFLFQWMGTLETSPFQLVGSVLSQHSIKRIMDWLSILMNLRGPKGYLNNIQNETNNSNNNNNSSNTNNTNTNNNNNNTTIDTTRRLGTTSSSHTHNTTTTNNDNDTTLDDNTTMQQKQYKLRVACTQQRQKIMDPLVEMTSVQYKAYTDHMGLTSPEDGDAFSANHTLRERAVSLDTKESTNSKASQNNANSHTKTTNNAKPLLPSGPATTTHMGSATSTTINLSEITLTNSVSNNSLVSSYSNNNINTNNSMLSSPSRQSVSKSVAPASPHTILNPALFIPDNVEQVKLTLILLVGLRLSIALYFSKVFIGKSETRAIEDVRSQHAIKSPVFGVIPSIARTQTPHVATNKHSPFLFDNAKRGTSSSSGYNRMHPIQNLTLQSSVNSNSANAPIAAGASLSNPGSNANGVDNGAPDSTDRFTPAPISEQIAHLQQGLFQIFVALVTAFMTGTIVLLSPLLNAILPIIGANTIPSLFVKATRVLKKLLPWSLESNLDAKNGVMKAKYTTDDITQTTIASQRLRDKYNLDRGVIPLTSSSLSNTSVSANVNSATLHENNTNTIDTNNTLTQKETNVTKSN